MIKKPFLCFLPDSVSLPSRRRGFKHNSDWNTEMQKSDTSPLAYSLKGYADFDHSGESLSPKLVKKFGLSDDQLAVLIDKYNRPQNAMCGFTRYKAEDGEYRFKLVLDSLFEQKLEEELEKANIRNLLTLSDEEATKLITHVSYPVIEDCEVHCTLTLYNGMKIHGRSYMYNEVPDINVLKDRAYTSAFNQIAQAELYSQMTCFYNLIQKEAE